MSNIVRQITATISLLNSNHQDEVGKETVLLCLAKAREEIIKLQKQLVDCREANVKNNVIRLDV